MTLLGQHRIATLVDVRSYPGSKRWPQFNQDTLSASVTRAGIEYAWMKSLGGRRRGVRADSPHTAWEHPAFRSYADYTETAEFAAGLTELIGIAARARTAYMCSEGLWWRCHRRIISDHLVARGWEVEHVMPDGKLTPHRFTAFARIDGEHVIYDGAMPEKSR